MDKRRLPHRGAANNIALFAPRFLEDRMDGFEKDMRICLTGIPSNVREGLTHAYFPALMTCCATLEYLAALYKGRIPRSLNSNEIADYAALFMPQPDYETETIRILFEAFRNAVAHRGIASGVWIDKHAATWGRRLTWKVFEDDDRPSLQVKEEQGELISDSPWPCKYSHRVHIHLGRLAKDIRDSVGLYLAEFSENPSLQSNFEKCMKRLYPA